MTFDTNSHHFTFSKSIEKLTSHTPTPLDPLPPLDPHPLAEVCVQFWSLFRGHNHLVLSNSIRSTIKKSRKRSCNMTSGANCREEGVPNTIHQDSSQLSEKKTHFSLVLQVTELIARGTQCNVTNIRHT